MNKTEKIANTKKWEKVNVILNENYKHQINHEQNQKQHVEQDFVHSIGNGDMKTIMIGTKLRPQEKSKGKIRLKSSFKGEIRGSQLNQNKWWNWGFI